MKNTRKSRSTAARTPRQTAVIELMEKRLLLAATATLADHSLLSTAAIPAVQCADASSVTWGAINTLASFNGSNGAQPFAGVITDSSGNLFGTAENGGASGVGTVFEIASGSSVITTLASFNGTNGAQPCCDPVLDSSGDLFGTATWGGPTGRGTVFEVARGSGVITTLGSFNFTNGDYPMGAVALDSSGNIFGATENGGNASLNNGYGDGTVFEIAHGSGVITALATFNGANGWANFSGVILDSSGDLFSTTIAGGANNDGTVFEIAHGSSAITTLVTFNGTNGATVRAGVTLDFSGNLFGTTENGGTGFSGTNNSGDGTVFEVAQGSGVITTLASFNGANGDNPVDIALDSSGNILGATGGGGANNDGTVFEVAQGSGVITTLASFNGANGENPVGITLDSSGNLFGTATWGGANGDGTVFELSSADTTITLGANGAPTLTDSATLSGGYLPDGLSSNITFTLDNPSNAVVDSETVAVSGNGTYSTPAGYTLPTSGAVTGMYAWNASYSGDADNVAQSGLAGSAERILVLPASPTLTTTASPSITLSAGGPPILSDSAVLSGGYLADGLSSNITFTLDLGSTQVYTTSDTVTANGTYSASYTLPTTGVVTGTYTWHAAYSGDADNNAATDQGGSAEQTVVSPASQAINYLSFNGTNGGYPGGAVMVDSSGDLFGTTTVGGAGWNGAYPSGDGTVFEIARGSEVITTLASFNGTNGFGPGASAVVEDSSGNLFGTTDYGGSGFNGAYGTGYGTVFEIAHGSSAITDVALFNGANGQSPNSGVIMDSSGNLFGEADFGGAYGDGTVFEVAHGTGAITAVASFNGANGVNPFEYVVMDSSGNIFGTAENGGAYGDGTVYEIAHGTGAITVLASFDGTYGNGRIGRVVLDSSGDLFGATGGGGTYGDGTVFEVAQGSSAITTLASLNGANGFNPMSGVIMDSSGNLFGTANNGGANGDGTLFELAQGSNTITTLVSFNGANGVFPQASVVLDSLGDLFSITDEGGANGDGTVFELMPGPTLVTTASPAVTLNSSGPPTLTDTAVLSGGYLADGLSSNITFTLDLGSTQVYTASDAVTTNGTYTASYTLPTTGAVTGTYTWHAVFSGDANNNGATDQSGTAEQTVVSPAKPTLVTTAGAEYFQLDPDGVHIDIWNSATATGAPTQSVLAANFSTATYTGPAGGGTFVLDFSNGDPLPAGGVSLNGGAGQNTLKFIDCSANDNAAVAVNSGSFIIPAGPAGAGAQSYALGSVSIASGAELALAQSDSQADQSVLTVNGLSVAGTLDIANNTLLADGTNVSLSKVTTWVQGEAVTSSLVVGPNAIASRAVGYGDWNGDPLTVPAGDVEVKYVPTGDANLDGRVDIIDLTRAINNLGLSPGYSGGDILNRGMVNIYDIAAIINDLGARLNSSGDSADDAAVAAIAAAGASPGSVPAAVAVAPAPAGASIGQLFSDQPIAADWLEGGGSVLAD